jgi:hypothetical protein
MSKLSWTQSGDFIDLAVINCEVYEYFVSNLNLHNINQYATVDFGFASMRDELLEKFSVFRNFVKTKLRSDIFDFDIDPSNQEHLNKLHRAWVKIHQQYPNIGNVFDRSLVNRINMLIHYIEDLSQDFVVETINPERCFKNIFGTKILNHGVWNVSIPYLNLGRSSYRKWVNGDCVNDSDTNNFDDLYTRLQIKTVPSEQYSLPPQFKSWCQQYGLECVGDSLPLANFDNLEQNMLKYRQLILTNSLIENNFIILE